MEVGERLDAVQKIMSRVDNKTTDEQIDRYANEICKIGDYDRDQALYYLNRKRF